jgi:hypothetical protein
VEKETTPFRLGGRIGARLYAQTAMHRENFFAQCFLHQAVTDLAKIAS